MKARAEEQCAATACSWCSIDKPRRGTQVSSETRGLGPSRREFLKGVGATGAGLVGGAVGAGSGLGSSPAEAATAAPAAIGTGRYAGGHGVPASRVDFGRIFPKLPPFAEANDTVRGALLEVGKPGGI